MYYSRFLVFISMLLLLTTYSHSEIYRWVDDQGNVEFTDEPREGAEKIEVGPTATITLPKLSDVETTSKTTSREPVPLYTNLAITFPENDSAFNSGSGDVTVLMTVDPSLYPNHSLRLTMDGKVVTTKENFYKFPNMDRGTHSLSLDIIDNSSVIMSGPSINFTVIRPSVIRRN